jgi:translation initiation factor 2 gamma subunit (eIF-2gamma)
MITIEKCEPCKETGKITVNGRNKDCEKCKGKGKYERELSYADCQNLVVNALLEAKCR